MKKILLILSLFFIAPFATHAETVNSYTEVYSDTTIENLNWSVSSIGGTYKNLLDSVYDYYKSSSDRVIIVSPKKSNFFYVYFYGIDSNLQVTFEDNNGDPYYLTNNSETTYKYCTFNGFFDSSYNLESQLSACDKKNKTSISSNKGKLSLLNAGGMKAVPYASNFAAAQFKEIDKRYAISYNGKTYVPYESMDFRSLMFRTYIDPNYSPSLFMPKITFSYVDIGVDDSDLINKVYVSYTSTVDFSDKNYTFYLKRPEQTEFLKIVGSGTKGAVTVSKNGSLIIKVVRNSDGYTSSFTLNLDAIGKNKDYLNEALGREENVFDETIGSLINSWKSNVLKAFPIFNQLSSILDLFKTHNYNNAICLNSNSTGFVQTSSSGNYCVPQFKVNFNFIGINKEFQIINYDFYSKYRDLIFTYIMIFVGVITFFKVIRILERLFG